MPKVDTVLVSMPWAPPTEPSLGLGILKSCIQTAGFSVKIYHAAPRLLRYLTLYTYSFLSERWGINEFLFTAALDPSCDDAQLDCLVKQCEIVEQKKYRAKLMSSAGVVLESSQVRVLSPPF